MIFIEKGSLTAEKGDLQKSMQYLGKALTLGTNYPLTHQNLSLVYKMMGKNPMLHGKCPESRDLK
jgi:hypothetical protein